MLFPKTLFQLTHLPPLPQQCNLLGLLNALEGKSHPEPQQTVISTNHPHSRTTSHPLPSQSYFLRSWIQTKMEKSPVVWVTAAIPTGLAKSRRQLETAAVRSTATGREGRKESEFIVYYTWSHSGLIKAGVFIFSSKQKDSSNDGCNNWFTTKAPLRPLSNGGYHSHRVYGVNKNPSGKEKDALKAVIKARHLWLEFKKNFLTHQEIWDCLFQAEKQLQGKRGSTLIPQMMMCYKGCRLRKREGVPEVFLCTARRPSSGLLIHVLTKQKVQILTHQSLKSWRRGTDPGFREQTKMSRVTTGTHLSQ